MLRFIQKFSLASSETLENFLGSKGSRSQQKNALSFSQNSSPGEPPPSLFPRLGLFFMSLLCMSMTHDTVLSHLKENMLQFQPRPSSTITYLPSPQHTARPNDILAELSHHVTSPLLVMQTETHIPPLALTHTAHRNHFLSFLRGITGGYLQQIVLQSNQICLL